MEESLIPKRISLCDGELCQPVKHLKSKIHGTDGKFAHDMPRACSIACCSFVLCKVAADRYGTVPSAHSDEQVSV